MAYLREVRRTFPLSIEAPRSARRWLRMCGVVPPELADAVDLIVSELVTNSVTHSGLSEPDVVSVRVASSPAGVVGEVIDKGRGMGRVPRPGAWSMGLRIVERTASRWGHADDPTCVWFELTPDRERSTRPRWAA
jgi:two-component sensor histidine kinase